MLASILTTSLQGSRCSTKLPAVAFVLSLLPRFSCLPPLFNYLPTFYLQIRDSSPRLPRPRRLGTAVFVPWLPFALLPSQFYCVLEKTRNACVAFHTRIFSPVGHPNARSHSLTPSHTSRLKETTPGVPQATFLYVSSSF